MLTACNVLIKKNYVIGLNSKCVELFIYITLLKKVIIYHINVVFFCSWFFPVVVDFLKRVLATLLTLFLIIQVSYSLLDYRYVSHDCGLACVFSKFFVIGLICKKCC
jgi:hypothetical protein